MVKGFLPASSLDSRRSLDIPTKYRLNPLKVDKNIPYDNPLIK